MRGNDNSRGTADLCQLFNAHGIGKDVTAGAAVLLGEVNTHHAELGHLFDGLHGEALFLIDFLSQGLDFGLCKVTVHFPDQQMLFGQMKIHSLLLLH